MSCTRLSGAALMLVVGCAIAAPATAQPSAAPAGEASQQAAPSAAVRQAEHDRIRHEREGIHLRHQREEAVCYRRFMVEDCLRVVRAQAREDEARLRVREIELNDAERKEKAAARLKAIEDKQRAVTQGADPAPRPRLGGALPDSNAETKLRDSQAAQRADHQRSKLQRRAQEQSARERSDSERAARAGARHAQRLEAAQQRRERVARSEAEAALQGRKRPAPLPTAQSPAP